ncbi:hypothetical protein FHS89_001040 [Rubricella aquisinus]|uniref:Helix-turn-helix domain-containing protein n=1 Tax=Rubricella aquisinus TaxID=2028108 RepID=A0A840WUZ7_9RHOB|nr:hypothetical protein [Rubricella aquisinus]MBB5515030.1 hypothetical protein [Rubricella aquisinus]
MAEDRVACRTPAEGREGVTSIPTWKFDLLRAAILDALSGGPMKNADLKDAVGSRLSPDDLSRLGKLGWHVITVKLELEVRGEIERIPGQKPLTIRLAQ